MPQERYGRYRIVGPIGQGGMASVHLAEDPVLHRVVAVKILRGDLGAQPEWVRRFHDEATSIARLGSPNVVAVHDFGREGGEDYLVMEFVDGISLSRFLELKAGRLDHVCAAAIACQVADGLRAAHGAGIIHRDIKPDNILVRRDGQTKIADFGISRLIEEVSRTRTGSVFGSPLFMAPEQVEGRNPSGAIDVFALAGVLYRVLSGRHPFEAEHAHAVMWRIVQEDAPRLSTVLPDIPAELDALVAAMHRRDPSARPRASEAARQLRQFLGARGCTDPMEAILADLPRSVVEARPVSAVATPTTRITVPNFARPGFLRRHRRFVPLVVSGSALVLAAFLAGKAWDRMQLNRIPAASFVPSPASAPDRKPAAAFPVQVSMRDESPGDPSSVKPRIAFVNRGGSPISWIRMVWPLAFPGGAYPVVDVYYAPKCAARLEGTGADGRLVVECADLSLSPGQTWPGPDGMSLSVHQPDWTPWKGKAALGLDRRMEARSDVRVETR
jgi:serine/threonine-protein kinase